MADDEMRPGTAGAARTEREMREHEREARERDRDERDPEGAPARSELGADEDAAADEPGAPGQGRGNLTG
jgi:hypothetical protein